MSTPPDKVPSAEALRISGIHAYHFYEILAVERYATLDEIKKAYKAKALLLHPDKSDEDKSAFQILGFAYDVLKDAAKKENYDRYLLMGLCEDAFKARVNNMLNRVFEAARIKTVVGINPAAESTPSAIEGIVAVPGTRTKITLKVESNRANIAIDFDASSIAENDKQRICEAIKNQFQPPKYSNMQMQGNNISFAFQAGPLEDNAACFRIISSRIASAVTLELQQILAHKHRMQHPEVPPPRSNESIAVTANVNDSNCSLKYDVSGFQQLKNTDLLEILDHVMAELKRFDFQVSTLFKINDLAKPEIKFTKDKTYIDFDDTQLKSFLEKAFNSILAKKLAEISQRNPVRNNLR